MAFLGKEVAVWFPATKNVPAWHRPMPSHFRPRAELGRERERAADGGGYNGKCECVAQCAMEVACGRNVVLRVHRRATSRLSPWLVQPCASGAVSVRRIARSGMTAPASPPTNAHVRMDTGICTLYCWHIVLPVEILSGP